MRCVGSLVDGRRAVGVVSILDAHDVATLLDVVDTTECCVHLFEHDALGLGDEEVDEGGEEDVDAGEHVEGVEAAFLGLMLAL